MKNIEVTDELLYKYMPLADDAEADALEAEIEGEEYVLSKKFEKRMNRLIWKDKHRWVGDFGKFMLKVAVVCLCILTVGLAVTMSVDAYRNKFFQTVQELMEDSALHTYDTNEDEQGFVPHEPTYIPEGYVEVSRVEAENMINIQYENEVGEHIYWDQIHVSMGEWYALDTEYIQKEYYKINNDYVTLYYYDDNRKYAYCEKDKYVYILCADNMDLSEIYLIIESIK